MPEVASAPGVAPRPWFDQTWPALLLLLVATLLPYLNSLHVPFYFDDLNNIVDNPLIRDLPRALRGFFHNRGPATLSFALNYRFGGLETTGFHVVNLAIHLGAVLLVWLLLRKLLTGEPFWALSGALLFAVHPLQTQAVTYIVQRMTSLAGLCFFLSVYLYIVARETSDAPPWRRRFCYLGALLGGALAVLSKQNAAVLPLVLLLVDGYFLPREPGRGGWRRLLPVLPFFVVPLWLTAQELLLPLAQGGDPWKIANPTSENRIPVLNYLVTEFSVLWIYIRLLFLPIGQVFDYSYPVVATVFAGKNLLAGLGLAGLLGWAYRCRHRHPLASFGIGWFFLTLAVESTIIPLDPVNEHRLYVPLFGFVLLVVDLLRRLPALRFLKPAVAVLVLLLALLTWQRNALWATPVAFLEENLRYTPNNVRVMVMLGNAYAAEQRPAEGVRLIEQAMRIDPNYLFVYTALTKILIDQGQGAAAIAPLQQGLRIHPDSVVLLEYLGIAQAEAGAYEQALHHLTRALRLQPDDASVHANAGLVLMRMGQSRQAVEYFRRAVELAPENRMAQDYYAAALETLRAEAAAGSAGPGGR